MNFIPGKIELRLDGAQKLTALTDSDATTTLTEQSRLRGELLYYYYTVKIYKYYMDESVDVNF